MALTRTGIFTRDGTLKLAATEAALWNASGTAVIAQGGRLVEVRLDGTRIEHGELSRFQWVKAWLPDGQILLASLE